MKKAEPILADRVRNIRDCTFGWLDHNLLHCGFIHRLSSESLLLYFFLCLVSDRNGCSYYDYQQICSLLKLTLDQYTYARQQLVAQSLIAFEDPIFQVLGLPQAKKNKLVFSNGLNRRADKNSKQAIQSLQGIFQKLGTSVSTE
jgi:hypothetical protein